MNFDRDLHKHPHNGSQKNTAKRFMMLFGGIILVFLLFFIMNNIVKTEVSALIQNKINIEKDKSLPVTPN